MKRWLKRRFINLLVRRLYKFVTIDDVLIQRGDGFYVGNTKLGTKHLQELQQQADIVLNLEIYKLMRKELTNVANEKIFLESKDYDDVFFGKAMLYNLDLMHKKLTKLSKM